MAKSERQPEPPPLSRLRPIGEPFQSLRANLGSADLALRVLSANLSSGKERGWSCVLEEKEGQEVLRWGRVRKEAWRPLTLVAEPAEIVQNEAGFASAVGFSGRVYVKEWGTVVQLFLETASAETEPEASAPADEPSAEIASKPEAPAPAEPPSEPSAETEPKKSEEPANEPLRATVPQDDKADEPRGARLSDAKLNDPIDALAKRWRPEDASRPGFYGKKGIWATELKPLGVARARAEAVAKIRHPHLLRQAGHRRDLKKTS
jgi:hypothetical protein